MENNKCKQYYLMVRNTFTGKTEKVFVSEEIYRTHKSFEDAEKKRKQRMMRCTVPNEKGKPVRCKEDCSKCEALRLGLIQKLTPLSVEGLIEQDFDIPDPNSDFEDSILERHEETETERLYRAIEFLTPRQQEIIKLHFFEGKNEYQIAKLLQVSQQSVNDTIQKAVKNLKKFF